jgi:F-box protein, helicase, 18
MKKQSNKSSKKIKIKMNTKKVLKNKPKDVKVTVSKAKASKSSSKQKVTKPSVKKASMPQVQKITSKTDFKKGKYASLGLDALDKPKKELKSLNIIKASDKTVQMVAQNATQAIRLPKPNAQQNAVIQSKAPCIRVHALAGTGKSTTVLHILNNSPNTPTLYVVFNSLLKTEMEERIRDAKIKCRVNVKTLHGYAYQWMAQNFFQGTSVNICQNRVQFSTTMGIIEGDSSGLLRLAKAYGLTGAKDASATWESAESYLNNVYRTLRNFYQSTDLTVENHHIAIPRYGLGGKVPVNTWIASDAHKIWIAMKQWPDQFAWDFDAMIRFMAMDKNPWPYERIILDEAQDSSYFFATAMYQQKHAQRIYLGDPHQSIYHFRNAYDATQAEGKDTVLTLSETHRFGPEIASLANQLLEIKGSSDRLIGMGNSSDIAFIDATLVPDPDKTTYIAATNNQLLDVAFKRFLAGKPYIITGDKEVTIQDALDLLALKKEFFTGIQSPIIKKFKTYEDLETYVQESGNDDYSIPMEWVKNPLTMQALPKLKHDILNKFTKDVTKIDLGKMCVLSTAHQLKGFTVAGDVFVCHDFKIPSMASLKAAKDSGNLSLLKELESQINIAYVAITRGSRKTMIDTRLVEKILKADNKLAPLNPKNQSTQKPLASKPMKVQSIAKKQDATTQKKSGSIANIGKVIK